MGCNREESRLSTNEDGIVLDVSISEKITKISFGERSDDGVYPIYWSEGDKIVVNGVLSEEAVIDSENPSNAKFFINDALTYPLSVIYPYSSPIEGEVSRLVLPLVQSYTENGADKEALAMCSYVENGGETVSLRHLSTVLRFSVKAASDGVELRRIVITSENGSLSGEFEIDCKTATLIPGNDANSQVTYNLPEGFKLSTTDESVFYVAIPSGNVGCCSVKFIDVSGAGMITYWNPDATVEAGIIHRFATIVYRPGNGADLIALEREEGAYEN